MRKTIFEIENRLDITKEFENLIKALVEKNTIFYDGYHMSFFEFLNKYVFNLWEYRDTFTDLEDYLEHIGITSRIINKYDVLTKEIFLNFLELLMNLLLVIENNIGIENVYFRSIKTKNIISHNVPIILEKMNYELYSEENTTRIRKRDADVDSILDLVPEEISYLLLSYNDIRNNNIESKKTLLKKIDLYIDANKRKYKEISKELLDSIETIVNNMGINHQSKESSFNNLSKSELNEWYDKCFKMMIHLIRTEDIINIKQERNELIKSSPRGDSND